MRGPSSLRSRLLLANLVVAGAALGTVGVAVSLVGPGYFALAMGHRPGDPAGAAMDVATRLAFDDSIRNALLAAGVIGVITSVVVSLAISSAIAGPVTRLAGAARRIARGHYAERVPAGGAGELGELAESFNAMTGSLEATEEMAHNSFQRDYVRLRTDFLQAIRKDPVEPHETTVGRSWGRRSNRRIAARQAYPSR